MSLDTDQVEPMLGLGRSAPHTWRHRGFEGAGYSLYDCDCGAKAIDLGSFSDYARLSQYVGPVRHQPSGDGS